MKIAVVIPVKRSISIDESTLSFSNYCCREFSDFNFRAMRYST